MSLTIGMAHFDDFEGASSTIQHFRQVIDEDKVGRVQYVLVDNSAKTHPIVAEKLRDLMKQVGGIYAECEGIGTSVPRDMIFRLATNDIVLVVDCHVLVQPGGVEAVVAQLSQPGCKDLVQGPLLNDRMFKYVRDMRKVDVLCTHMDDVWRWNMWGIWGRAWQCPCGANLFSVIEDNGLAKFIKLQMRVNGQHELAPALCGKGCPCQLQKMQYAQHEGVLNALGFRDWASDGTSDVIEIPGMGLGLFACRREAWTGFVPGLAGFGGEEMNLHEKFRANGGRCLCVKQALWWHRFFKTYRTDRPMTDDMIRNYMRWNKHFGRTNDEMRECYIRDKVVTEPEFDRVVATPDAYTTQKYSLSGLIGGGAVPGPTEIEKDYGRPQPPVGSDLKRIYEFIYKTDRDVNRHLPTLMNITKLCDTAIEFSGRRESAVGIIAGLPRNFVSFTSEPDQIYNAIHRAMAAMQTLEPSSFSHKLGDSLLTDIPEVDFLYIDTVHTYERFKAELNLHSKKVKRFIGRHDTESYGQKGEDGKDGLHRAIKEFLEENPEWFVYQHDPQQYGMTILGRQEQDRPKYPIWVWDPGFGPGTEMFEILHEWGIQPDPKCDCKSRAADMNKWGVEQCKANRDTILGWIYQSKASWGWDKQTDDPQQPSTLKVAMKAATTTAGWKTMLGMLGNAAHKLLLPEEGDDKPLMDPVPVLVDLSIARAEAKLKK